MSMKIRILSSDRKWVTVRIEDPLFQWEDRVIFKDEVQILEGGRDEEIRSFEWVTRNKRIGLNLVRSEESVRLTAVTIDSQRHLPGSVSILLVLCNSPENEIGLSHFGSETRKNINN